MNISKLSVSDLDRESITAYKAGRMVDAINFCGMAIKKAPANDQLKIRYAAFIEEVRINSYDLDIKIAVTACLKCDALHHQKIGAAWTVLLLNAPAYPFLFDKNIDEQKYWKSIDTLLNDDFFLLGVRKLLLTNPIVEKALTRLRKTLLLASQNENRLRGKHIPLLNALAIQNYYNEYVWTQDAQETALIDALAQAPSTPLQLALLGCYRPLHHYPQARDWLDTHGKGPVADLIKTHLEDYFTEQDIKKGLKNLSPIEETTSRAVQEMYEENPYPRWRSIDMPSRDYPEVALDWLTAGCGTGRPLCQLAALYPNARFTAIDLSRSSLAYAVRQTREAGETNIDFYHGDLLNIGDLGKDFDFIESSGVLHHMKDPLEGWRALLTCLRPGGRMQIGLYSTDARDIIFKVRSYIEEKGYQADAAGIRALRADIMARPDDHPLHPILDRQDFYAASECRDLVFHIQEHTYTIPKIKEMLDELGLVFLGFKLRSQVRAFYGQRFPADTAMTNLDNWHALEQEIPALFIGCINSSAAGPVRLNHPARNG
jgi:SAM-dependent methyltransferase